MAITAAQNIQQSAMNSDSYNLDSHEIAYEPWELGSGSDPLKLAKRRVLMRETLETAVAEHPWQWPKQPIIFVSDAHADAEAFSESLLASGGVRLNRRGGFILTALGRKAVFVIGGDCLDKGPSNLALLRRIKMLIDCRAKVKLLAGNHDVRLLVGLRALSLPKHCDTEHMFARMSPKVIPLLLEIYQEYVQGKKSALKGVPSAEICRQHLMPAEAWAERFSASAQGRMSADNLQRELARMRKKIAGLENAFLDAGMNIREVYATAKVCQKLFLKRKGEFSWFFKTMQLAYRSGSFLFIHAGLDDEVISIIESDGVKKVNKIYKKQIEKNLFDFYYGSVANTMRTKYRDVDMPLTKEAVKSAFREGIHAVVHGHRNRLEGQRLMLRQGMLHIEGDITMDRNSRIKEGLSGIGIGATIIEPQGWVLGISNDYPAIKVFSPARYLQ
ncbi:metallophosphoesterase family protein [Zhongshania aliphaticivorans]|nr:metallophosphoesterase family protein [Zhongshania aliphaticivorans]